MANVSIGIARSESARSKVWNKLDSQLVSIGIVRSYQPSIWWTFKVNRIAKQIQKLS